MFMYATHQEWGCRCCTAKSQDHTEWSIYSVDYVSAAKVAEAALTPPPASESEQFNQHLLCGGRNEICRHACHQQARGTWLWHPDVLSSFADGRWRGNWTDGSNHQGLTNEWCPRSSHFLWFSQIAIRKCLRHRHLLIVGDSSMRIFFSALVSMVNGTKEWDTPDMQLSSWRLGLEDWERRKSTCDYKRNGNVERPCFRTVFIQDADVRLSFVWKTFVNDLPLPGRHRVGRETTPSVSFSDSIFDSFILHSQQPDIVLVESGIWDNFNDTTTPLADWISRRIRRRYDGPLIFVQPPNSPQAFDAKIRRLGLPVLWRRPSSYPPPNGFPYPTFGQPHASDVLAVEHVNMLLSSACI